MLALLFQVSGREVTKIEVTEKILQEKKQFIPTKSFLKNKQQELKCYNEHFFILSK